MIVALAGGVGGAKLASGLAAQLPADRLIIVVNTGDDFVHLGLHVSPDVDTVMYWLASCNDSVRGWGVAGESWNFMNALEKLGGPAWFLLGDRDLATHVERTRRLGAGESLSAVTRALSRQLGVVHEIVPMTDARVRTIVHTSEGPLEFQHYFVRRHCEPTVSSIEFDGAAAAVPSPAFDSILSCGDLEAIVLCPSNPYLSIGPILDMPDVRRRIRQHCAPVIAVSPIVAGKAIKGPAAKIFQELGREASALEVARFYGDLIDGIVIDTQDAGLKTAIEALGSRVCVADTIMRDRTDQARLAQTVIDFAAAVRAPAEAR
jgi:LPPG:FO 2-phospho-L-lactate transferase